ncbi:hypothetical protein [Niallia circulans]|uniref:hypothetical protein n=1 Tax=Niallia circulans TaxID=1397 RepID=UPI00325A46F3
MILSHFKVALEYAESIVSGKKVACKENCLAAKRFLNDLDKDVYEFRQDQFDFVVDLIQGTIAHQQGESLLGEPLKGTPLFLQPWQIFVIVNSIGFLSSWY